MLLCLSMLLIVLDARFHLLTSFHRLGQRFAMPLRLSAAWPGAIFENVSDYFVDKTQLLQQNTRLQQALLADQVTLQHFSDLQLSDQKINDLLQATLLSSLPVIITKVVNSEGYPYLQRIFIRHNASIEMNAAVLTADGVVGQVIASEGSIDTVLPLVDAESYIPVQTADHTLRAIAQGDGRNGLLIKQVEKSDALKVGEEFVTSGLGGIYPAGYSVGKITGIVPSDDEVFLSLRLKPSVNVSNVDYVAVLTQGKQDA